MLSAFTLSAGSSLASSSVTFNASSALAVKLSPGSLGTTSRVPLLDPSPTPTDTTTPTPVDTTTPTPTPAPTVTVTVAPPGPSQISGTVKLDDGQYLGLTSGLVLLLLFVVAGFIAHMRRP